MYKHSEEILKRGAGGHGVHLRPSDSALVLFWDAPWALLWHRAWRLWLLLELCSSAYWTPVLTLHAVCSLATVLGAYNEKYEGIKPNEIITGIEKKYADPKAWSREHEKHSLRSQMPLSLHGISSLLTKGKVSNEYVPFFSYDEEQ